LNELERTIGEGDAKNYEFLVHHMLALCHSQRGDHNISYDLAQRAVSLAPDIFWVLAGLARCSLAAGHIKPAEKYFDLALANSDFSGGLHDISMHIDFAKHWHQNVEFMRALIALKAVLQASRDHYHSWIEIRNILSDMTKFAQNSNPLALG
jgi:tetratricopeptide (TPR) repeat protein